jgi:hypothetical protein
MDKSTNEETKNETNTLNDIPTYMVGLYYDIAEINDVEIIFNKQIYENDNLFDNSFNIINDDAADIYKNLQNNLNTINIIQNIDNSIKNDTIEIKKVSPSKEKIDKCNVILFINKKSNKIYFNHKLYYLLPENIKPNLTCKEILKKTYFNFVVCNKKNANEIFDCIKNKFDDIKTDIKKFTFIYFLDYMLKNWKFETETDNNNTLCTYIIKLFEYSDFTKQKPFYSSVSNNTNINTENENILNLFKQIFYIVKVYVYDTDNTTTHTVSYDVNAKLTKIFNNNNEILIFADLLINMLIKLYSEQLTTIQEQNTRSTIIRKICNNLNMNTQIYINKLIS